jgi:iron complex transport system substrate-binding protein
VLLALLAACGGAPAVQPTAAPAPQPASADAAPQPVADAFPITLEHAFGSTTIPAEPQRVIALGYSEVDPLLALGVVPIAVRDWFGEQPDAVWPWSQERLGGAAPTVLQMPFGELNYETIAALDPDLIVATHAGISDAEYATLSAIAPTLAQSDDFPTFGMPWQEQTLLIGRAVGRAAAAQELVERVEAQIAAAQAAHPELAGKTVAWMSPAEGDSFWVVGPNTPPLRFLTALGLAYPAPVADFVGANDSLQLSSERLDLIDTDVLIVYAGTPEAYERITANALFGNLGAVAAGRTISFTGNDAIYGALSYSTVASLPYALERLLPLLTAAADGDPATVAGAETASCAADQRAIAGAFGLVCIPAAPQRIIALNEGVMANLLALGVTPVGVSDYANRDYTGYLGDTTGTIASVGTPDGPNFEAMLALNPDLILGMPSDVDEQTLPLFEAIAPLAISPSDSVDWRGNFSFAGAAVGKTEQAAYILERTEARLAAFRAAYAAQADDATIAIIRSRADSFNIYNRESFIAELVKEAGLRMPPAFDDIEPWNSMSLENITLLSGEKLFVMVRNEREAGAFRELSASPLWQTIPAVQNDAVEIVNWNVWVAGWNIVGANLVIDDLYFYMLGREPEQPNPLSDLIIPGFGPQNDAVRLGM